MEHQLVIMDDDKKLHLLTVNKKFIGKDRMKIIDDEGERDVWRILSADEYNDVRRGKWNDESRTRPPHEDQIKKGWFVLPDVKMKGQNAINVKKMGLRIEKIFKEN